MCANRQILDEIAASPAPTLEGEHIASFLWRRTAGEKP